MAEEKKAQKKRKKPAFLRQNYHKKAKFKLNWRRPRGSGSKVRIGAKGYVTQVKIGWGAPKATRGLDKFGLRNVVVDNKKQLAKLNPAKDSVVIASSTGIRTKLEIIAEALKLKLKIVNIKDPAKFTEEAKIKKQAEKAVRAEKMKRRASKHEEDKKAADKKKKEEEKKDVPAEDSKESKEAEKKELDKTLITAK
jgi:large subunit ribosomal protein L32e